MDDTEARSFLETAFARLFDPNATREQVLEFFSPEYEQDLNGEVYPFEEFYKGVVELKSQLHSVEINFTRVIAGADTIAEVHVVKAVKNDGSNLRFKVMAFQKLANGRIVGVEEVNCSL